jgi:aldose 1-epimerase
MSILEAVHPSVERDALEGFEAVTLAAGALEATFVPSLGMVAGSLRHAGEELLDRGAGLRAYRDEGAVMGVPLLHPWANRLARDELIVAGHRIRLPGPPTVWRDEHGLPIHGLLGAHPGWSVHEADADGHAARLIARLDFAANARLMAAFPFPHELVLEATLSARSLRVATKVRATGAMAVPIAFGYHPYLRIPRVSRADWHVRLPARRRLELDELAIPTGGGTWESAVDFRLGDASFDDGYDRIDDGAVFSVAGVRSRDPRDVQHRLRGRAGVLAARCAVHLLRADDGADQRAVLGRRPAVGRARRRVHRGVHDRRELEAQALCEPVGLAPSLGVVRIAAGDLFGDPCRDEPQQRRSFRHGGLDDRVPLAERRAARKLVRPVGAHAGVLVARRLVPRVDPPQQSAARRDNLRRLLDDLPVELDLVQRPSQP